MDALLTQASSVFVHLDPRRDRVVVPPHFRKQPMLVLEIGLNMRVPIPDLEIDEEAIGCTLSFGGRSYWCRMPWDAVFALVTSEQRGMVWPPDVPPEVADRFAPPPPAAAKPKPAGPKLVAVPSSDESQGGAPTPPEDGPPEDGPMAAYAPAEEQPSQKPAEGNEGTEEPADDDAGEPGAKRKIPPYLRVVK